MTLSLDAIRNFVIISHIDHGKSTLADRLIEYTATIPKEKMIPQILDRHPIERERGITIKMQPIRMKYFYHGKEYILNLIDTPGHIDFSYEVSRALACVEGALLLVDATQGIQAQTLTTYSLAREQHIAIVPVINKIDLPHADVSHVRRELSELMPDGVQPLLVSAKTGEGIDRVIEELIRVLPPPSGNREKPPRALIFDSIFDSHRGVIAYIRIFDGVVKSGDSIYLIGARQEAKVIEAGYFKPDFISSNELSPGEIGYIVSNLKYIRLVAVGDTVTKIKNLPAGKAGQKSEIKNDKNTNREIKVEPLPGFQPPMPMVWATIYPSSPANTPLLRNGLEKLQLNDGAFQFEPESSPALGAGFRVGALGLLHLEIVLARLQHDFGQEVIVAKPSVPHLLVDQNGASHQIHSIDELPSNWSHLILKEPWLQGTVVTPLPYLGRILELVKARRGLIVKTDYFANQRLIVKVELPLSEVVIDFYDQLKSLSSGYASFSYQFSDWRAADLALLDVRIADMVIEPLRQLIHKKQIDATAKSLVDKLHSILPRQQFEVKVQACVGGTIIATARIPPYRKDVTAKLYGGDVTRKRKLLEKQKTGKNRLRSFGTIELSSEFFHAALRR